MSILDPDLCIGMIRCVRHSLVRAHDLMHKLNKWYARGVNEPVQCFRILGLMPSISAALLASKEEKH